MTYDINHSCSGLWISLPNEAVNSVCCVLPVRFAYVIRTHAQTLVRTCPRIHKHIPTRENIELNACIENNFIQTVIMYFYRLGFICVIEFN